MRQIILDFPSQFKVGIERAKDIKIKGSFNKIFVSAMGGSALPAKTLNIWLKSLKKNPLLVHRDYGLPYLINKRDLLICISYSGNTEETISCFKQAVKKNLKIIVIASGGKLEKLCEKNKIPLIKIPKGIPPRLAIGYQFSALVKILENLLAIKNIEKKILKTAKELKPKILEEKAKILASKIIAKIPLIYVSNELKELAQIWKINFNENSKIPAFVNYFPELNHNEMLGFINPQRNFHLIILRDSTNSSSILKRMKLTANFFKKRNIKTDFIDISNKNILTKVFSNILLAIWTSYYLALKYKINPISVKPLEEFKKKMAN